MKNYIGLTVRECIEDAKNNGIIIDLFVLCYFMPYANKRKYKKLYASFEGVSKSNESSIIMKVDKKKKEDGMHIVLYYRAIQASIAYLIATEVYASKGETKFIIKRSGFKDRIMEFNCLNTFYNTVKDIRFILKTCGVRDTASDVNHMQFIYIKENNKDIRYCIITDFNYMIYS